MKRISSIIGTLLLFGASVYLAFMQGQIVPSNEVVNGEFIASSSTMISYTGIREVVATSMAHIINALLAVSFGNMLLAITVLALIVELVTLVPAARIQLKQKKIHTMHKKLIDKFENGELAVSETEEELHRIYAVNEKIHARGAFFVALQLVIFLAVLWGLALIAKSPAMVSGAWNFGTVSLLAQPQTFLIPLVASLLYFLHALVKITLRQQEDYISPVQVAYAMVFAVIGAAVTYHFSTIFALALTVYFVTLMAFSTIRYIIVENHARAWSKKATKDLIKMLQEAEPHKDRFELISRKWNHLPVVRYINFNLLEEALSMSLGLLLALNVLGAMNGQETAVTRFITEVPTAQALQNQCSTSCSDINQPFFGIVVNHSVNTSAPSMTCRPYIFIGGTYIPNATDLCSTTCCKSTNYGNRSFDRGSLTNFGDATGNDLISGLAASFSNKLSCSGAEGSENCFMEYTYSPTASPVSISCPSGPIYIGDTKTFSASGGVKFIKFQKLTASGTNANGSISDPNDSNHDGKTNVTFTSAGTYRLEAYDTNSSSNDADCSVAIYNKPAITNSPGSNNGLAYDNRTFDFNYSGGDGSVTWSIVSGVGTINSSTGEYNSGTNKSGTVTVRVHDGQHYADRTFNIEPRAITHINTDPEITINESYTFSLPPNQGPFVEDVIWTVEPAPTYTGTNVGTIVSSQNTSSKKEAIYTAGPDPETTFVVRAQDPVIASNFHEKTITFNNKCSAAMFLENYAQRNGAEAGHFLDGSGSTLAGELEVLTGQNYRFYLNDQLIYDQVGIDVSDDTNGAILPPVNVQDYVQFKVSPSAPIGSTATVRVYDAIADTAGCDFTIPARVIGHGPRRKTQPGNALAPIINP